MARPKLQVTKMRARLERLAAEREARARTRPITGRFTFIYRARNWSGWSRERRLYAFAPSRSAVLRQLVVEGLMFRKAHRPQPPRPAKRAPLPPELKARLEL